MDQVVGSLPPVGDGGIGRPGAGEQVAGLDRGCRLVGHKGTVAGSWKVAWTVRNPRHTAIKLLEDEHHVLTVETATGGAPAKTTYAIEYAPQERATEATEATQVTDDQT